MSGRLPRNYRQWMERKLHDEEARPGAPDVYPSAATGKTISIHGGPVRMPSSIKDGRPDPPGEILRVRLIKPPPTREGQK